MLQHVIQVKARIFKDVSTRNEQNTVLLKESEVDYSKLNQLTLFCKQQGIPEDYFEPASYLLIDYWGRFFPRFDFHEAYYEYSGAGDFALTICFRRSSRKIKGETRDLKEKVPELFGFCLREVDIQKMESKDQELSKRKEDIKNLETEYDLFKEFAEQDIQKKNSHLDELQEKYQKVEIEKKQLREETTVQEVTIDQLQAELMQLQLELGTVKQQLHKRKDDQQATLKAAQEKREAAQQEEMPAEQVEKTVAVVVPRVTTEPAIRPSAVKQSAQPPNGSYRELFSPALVEKKEEFQRQIKERFRQSQRPGGRDKVKISEEAYNIFVENIDFLDFQWSQSIGGSQSKEDREFFEWCQKFIDHLPNFKDDLHLKVKRTVLRKETFGTTRETLHKLQGYALLNQYLELTLENSQVNEEEQPFIHN